MKFQLALKELNVKLKDDYGPGNIKGVGVTIDLPAIDMVRLYEIHVSNTEKIKRAMTEDNDAVNFKLFQKHKRKMRRRLMRLARNFQRWYKRGYHVYENQPLVYEMTEFLLAAEKDKENSGKAW